MRLELYFWFSARQVTQVTIVLLSMIGCLLITLNVASAQPVSSDRTSECRRILNLALDRALRIEDPVLQVQTRCRVAEAQARIGNKVEAKATYLAILPLALKNQDNNQCERALSHLARWLAVEKDIPDAMRVVEQTKGVGKQAWLLYDIVLAQARAGQFASALTTSKKLVSSDLLPSSYAQIALAQAKSGQTEAAENTFGMSLQLANNMTDVQRKPVMLREIVQARAQAGEFEKARALADTIHDSASHDIALGSLAAAQAEAGDPRSALAILKKVKDVSASDSALMSVALQYTKRNNIDEGLRICSDIKDMNWRQLTLSQMIWGLIKMGKISQALLVLLQEQTIVWRIAEGYERATAYLDVAAQQYAVNQHAEAITTLNLLPPLMLNVGDDTRGNFLRARLAGLQAHVGQVEVALQTAHLLHSLDYRGYAMHRIASARIQAGEGNAVNLWCESLPTTYEQTEGLLGIVDGLYELNNLKN